MSTVQFNRVDEFLEELHKNARAAAVARNIVRVSALHRSAVYSDGKGGKTVIPWIKRISTIATYELTEGHGLVRLEEYTGEQSENGPQESNERVWARGTRIKQAIEEVCAKLQIEIRGGEVTEVPT